MPGLGQGGVLGREGFVRFCLAVRGAPAWMSITAPLGEVRACWREVRQHQHPL